jgi:uncharacterized protein YggL (DUF469 family)
MDSDDAYLGFRVEFHVDPNLSILEERELLGAFVSDAIEKNGLFCHGGGLFVGFANAAYPASATDAHRQAVVKWLAGHPSVVEFEVGPLEVEPEPEDDL